jgi:hypothetical protein
MLINRLTLKYPYNYYYAPDVEENDQNHLHLQLVNSYFFCFFVEVGVLWRIACLFISVEVSFPFSFIRNFRVMRRSISTLRTSNAEQHNTVTLKQSSEANTTGIKRRVSLVRFEKYQGRLSLARSSLLQVSKAECAQSRHLTATPSRQYEFQLLSPNLLSRLLDEW